jgi:hypothetical protein
MTIKEKLSEINPDAIVWDGLDSAIIGFTDNGKAVYDIDKMVSITQQTSGDTFEDALIELREK